MRCAGKPIAWFGPSLNPLLPLGHAWYLVIHREQREAVVVGSQMYGHMGEKAMLIPTYIDAAASREGRVPIGVGRMDIPHYRTWGSSA